MERMGKRVKQTTNRAKAARFKPPNMSSLSHLLTAWYLSAAVDVEELVFANLGDALE